MKITSVLTTQIYEQIDILFEYIRECKERCHDDTEWYEIINPSIVRIRNKYISQPWWESILQGGRSLVEKIPFKEHLLEKLITMNGEVRREIDQYSYNQK